MAIDVTIAGLRVGLQRPLVMLAFPVLGVLLGYLLLWGREETTFDRRKRTLIFASRLAVVALLVVGAAAPFTVAEREVQTDPTVTMLVDRSASMEAVENVSGQLASAIENEGVTVDTRQIGSGTRSPVGDGVASALRANGGVLVVSDGRVTRGRTLDETGTIATQVNATVNAVELTTSGTERAVSIQGPAKTSTGVDNAFLIAVTGTNLDDTNTTVAISVDGTEIGTRQIAGSGAVAINQSFDTTGSHRITARIDGGDAFPENDVYRKTVRVVEPPKILYVARGDYPFEDYLGRLYDVERADSVPADLSGYYAVVLQNVAAGDVGNTAALQRAVINGTGLVTVGGPNAYEYGDYRGTALEGMTPVTVGEGGRTARIVFAIDISGSTRGSLSVQQSLALDALSNLGDRNQVGVVAFNRNAYAISSLQGLDDARTEVARQIRRLENQGGTDVSAGIEGGVQMLGNSDGTVVLLTDGQSQVGDPVRAAARAANRNVRVIPIGVGADVNDNLLRQIARAGEGTYLRADETNKLRLFFGGESRQYQGGGLTVVDDDEFITRGVRFASSPAAVNAVATKDRAEFLVAGPTGTPAFASWRYGLGRSVSITAYDSQGTLGGLLSRPDSLAVTKAVNWAIGDPERLESGVTEVADGRVGTPLEITYEGPDRPGGGDVTFAQVGENTFRATIVPDEPGYRTVLDATFAVNYPAEYAAFGPSSSLRGVVAATNGTVYAPGQAAEIAQDVRRRASEEQTVRDDWTWLALLVGLLVYLTEVCLRRYDRIKA
jgi:Mg-chelatase subunit ChlD